MQLSADQVYQALGTVIEPDLKLNIVDLGLICDVKLTESNGKHDIDVTMTLVSAGCPYGPVLLEAAKKAVESLGSPVGTVRVGITFTPPWTPDRMTQEAKGELGYS